MTHRVPTKPRPSRLAPVLAVLPNPLQPLLRPWVSPACTESQATSGIDAHSSYFSARGRKLEHLILDTAQPGGDSVRDT
jgi:hypothetical protein